MENIKKIKNASAKTGGLKAEAIKNRTGLGKPIL